MQSLHFRRATSSGYQKRWSNRAASTVDVTISGEQIFGRGRRLAAHLAPAVAGSAPEHFGEDEDKRGTAEAAAEEKINEGVTGRGDRKDEVHSEGD